MDERSIDTLEEGMRKQEVGGAMSEGHARLVWRPGEHRAGAGSTASSFNKTSWNLSVKELSSKKHLDQITLKGCSSPSLYGGGRLTTKRSLGLFFLFCFLTFGSYPHCPRI